VIAFSEPRYALSSWGGGGGGWQTNQPPALASVKGAFFPLVTAMSTCLYVGEGGNGKGVLRAANVQTCANVACNVVARQRMSIRTVHASRSEAYARAPREVCRAPRR